MAIYHFSVKVISRANGSSALASAAYRSASRLRDERLGRSHDFTSKVGVVHSEVLLPEGANEEWSDREALWNEVEAGELRKDAQLSREVEFAIPRELSQRQGIELARDFVAETFVSQGMVADLNVHWDLGADGLAKPHAHVMLTMRGIERREDGCAGFGGKVRDWNSRGQIERWRESWENTANGRLAELGIDARIDRRSLADQGIELEPQIKLGGASLRMERDGLLSDRLAENLDIARANGERIIADPNLALDAITRQQATFTMRDLELFVHRHSADKEQFDRALDAVRSAPDLVALGRDGRGMARFTSREMIQVEMRLEQAVGAMAARGDHRADPLAQGHAVQSAVERGLVLSGEQRAAFEHVTRGEGLSVVIGYAGTGKSALLGVAREAWEQSGFQVRGAALSGIAAENLTAGSGIAARTIASLEHGWDHGRDLLTTRDVLVIDEAGMIGTRQMERVVSAAREAGAKLVLVGDPQQLQAIEAGATFRSIAEQVGSVEITDIRRQHEGWQREATRDLATGRTEHALDAYRDHGDLHLAPSREAARAELVAGWSADQANHPGDTSLILAHTNADVRELNQLAREAVREAGMLGAELAIETERGMRDFAIGDRLMFLRNERELGVRNGSLGTVTGLAPERLTVALDDGRAVAFDPRDYNQIDHGYAATIHKAQGVTVTRAHVLATPGMDQHSTYVALSRHRESVTLHYARDDFADDARLTRTLARERAKDMALDYSPEDHARRFAERRGLSFRERVLELGRKVGAKMRRIALGLRPDRTSPEPPRDLGLARREAVVRHARAVTAVFAMQEQGLDLTSDQVSELQASRAELNALRPEAARDIETAYKRDPELAREAAHGNAGPARDAMIHESEMRTNPRYRADHFVERWQSLDERRTELRHDGHYSAARECRSAMADMAKSLERDPQLESLLANRRRELGIAIKGSEGVGMDLLDSIGLGRKRGIGI